MTTQLTTAQRKTLRLVADNPGRVSAVTGTEGYLSVRGMSGLRLWEAGLVTMEIAETRSNPWGTEYKVQVFELTETGRAAQLAGR